MTKKRDNLITVLLMIFIACPFIRLLLTRTHLFKAAGWFETAFWWEYDRVIFLVGLFFLMISILKHHFEMKFTPSLLFMTLFGAWMFAATYVTGFDDTVVNGTVKNVPEGLMANLGFVMFFAMTLFLFDEKKRNFVLRFFVAMATVLEILLLVDFYILDKSWNLNNYMFYQFNHTGYFLVCAVVADAMVYMTAETGKGKILGALLTVLGTQALIINNTLGAYIGVGFGLVFIVIVHSIINKKFRFDYCVPLLLAVLSVLAVNMLSADAAAIVSKNGADFLSNLKAAADPKNAPGSAGTGRLVMYRKAVEMIREKPLFGWGWQASMEGILESSNGYTGLCHCEYLQYAMIYGLPAALFYVAGVFAVFLRALRFRDQLTKSNLFGLCVAFAYCVSAASGNAMFMTAPYLFIFLALGYVPERINRPADETAEPAAAPETAAPGSAPEISMHAFDSSQASGNSSTAAPASAPETAAPGSAPSFEQAADVLRPAARPAGQAAPSLENSQIFTDND